MAVKVGDIFSYVTQTTARTQVADQASFKHIKSFELNGSTIL